MCITICNDPAIRKLNKTYRFKDKATDVLSFPVYEDHDQKLPILNLGDVIISIDTAKRQAVEYDVNLYQEVLRLLIHGILHLLGYDHENVPKKEELRMRRKEDLLYHQLLKSARGLV